MHIISRLKIYRNWLIWRLALFFMLLAKSVFPQNEGSLFMLPDNFQAQILNPSYFNEEDVIFALPGLAGISLSNEGNFRFTDLVYTKPTGETVYDLGRFSEKGHSVNLNSVQLSLPLLYVGIPVKKGMVSFYMGERANAAIRFPINSIVWFNNGNLPDEFHNFQSGNIRFNMLGFYETGIGYARSLNKKLRFGIRGKLLFGQMYIQVSDWSYGIQTSPEGDMVRLSSQGSGVASIPFPIVLDDLGKFQKIETQNAVADYLSVRNPGIAVDGGITLYLSEKKQFSASVTDLGLISFSDNSWGFYQNDVFDFYGIDISNSINSKLGDTGYVLPFYLMTNVKDSLRNVYKPIAKPRKLLRGPSPQTYLHYQYKYSQNLSFGITNHTVFQKSYIMNSLSLNALRREGNFSFIGNVSLHQLTSLTLGGGLQWKTAFTQLFVFTDNIAAIYHPATQKSYSLTFGMNFLIGENNGVSKNRKTNYSRRGKISKYFPFYRKYK